jgi:Kdo2-lipid IVA lauroyltransferase/acyltransferase
MKSIKYFIQFIIINFLFFIFRILGYKNASNLGSLIGLLVGPFFRSKKLIIENLERSFKDLNKKNINIIYHQIWKSYGRILSNYVFIKDFRNDKLIKFLKIEGHDVLEKIRKNDKPVIFISGHFDNFELMAMEIEKRGINLAAIYRPLNNTYLNKVMENIRKKFICKMQIKKGKSGVREMLTLFKKGFSIALMIDQRVSEGIKSKFFDREASTTTIPAQLIKRFNCEVVPVNIYRKDNHYFNIKFYDPITFDNNKNIDEITQHLNLIIEKMISNNPGQWIWTHNRWK